MHLTIRVVSLALLFILLPQQVTAQSRVSLGAEYSEGDFGSGTTTTAWYIPLAWHYRKKHFMSSVTIPWLRVEGPADQTFDGRRLTGRGNGSGSGSGAGGGTTSTTRSASGLGDVLVAGGYLLMAEERSRPWLATTAKIKFGTADEQEGLGTGENDFALQLEAGKGPFYAYMGRKWLGDTAAVDYDDPTFYGLTAGLALGEMQELEFSYYIEETSVSGLEDIEKAKVSLRGKLVNRMGYAIFIVAGMSDSTADSVIGINLSSPL